MSESAQEVLHELTAAGLLSSDQATKYGAEIETGTEVLLQKLIDDGHITEYQAQKFRDGKASDIYFGDYVVIDKLGQGGMGTVLLARHRRMDRQVAIKVLPVTVLESKDAVARFYQEVKVAAQLTHPNIVLSFDAGEHHGFHYLVMEYVPGHDLAEVLSQLGPIPIPMALDYVSQAAKGLNYAHGKGVVHRDIKPSNLLLNDEGVIKILDMGLARLGTTINQEVTQLTTTGQVMGTVEYMSPEQAEDTRQADVRSDIYSLGCTLYRLLTGRSPFSRDTVVKTILAHRSDAIPQIETGFPEDNEVNGLFQRMVAKKPEDRFQSTSSLIAAIEHIEQGGSLNTFDSQANPIMNSPPDRPASPMTQVTAATAIVERFNSQAEPADLPEALPVSSSAPPSTRPRLGPGNVQYISDDSVPMPPNSEVIYIPELTSKRNRISRARDWIKADRSRGIVLWSIFGVLACWIPVVGVLVSWFTWRAANQDLRDMANGRRDPQRMWLTRSGKIVAIFTTVIGIVFTGLAMGGVHPIQLG
ncbi:MAG: serine/threonine-protein kinase [Planctomycetota bacterium]